MLAEKAGYDVATPHGADRLQKEIESQTGERLSVNTIKRLAGILPYKGSIRISTVDILARYLGYSSAKELMAIMEGNTSDFKLPPHYLDLSELHTDERVILEWSPNRRIIIRNIKEGRYIVEKAFNSKLKEGDILEVGVVAEGMPFMVRDVIRADRSLGPYTAAQESGMSKVEIFSTQNEQ